MKDAAESILERNAEPMNSVGIFGYIRYFDEVENSIVFNQGGNARALVPYQGGSRALFLI
ncbi:hypothetical protein AM592_17860 [Bacillus gobiensis]|uniref:Uncharacterized protein n=2 Tax=Bacillus TaxID=1386 RepID=A0A0M4GBQ4_9BACI|nr:hypothetical protein AM592_17860 [Bacillus gobiensis]MBP1084213.1 hypothetical protein [Bacillus capparidis]